MWCLLARRALSLQSRTDEPAYDKSWWLQLRAQGTEMNRMLCIATARLSRLNALSASTSSTPSEPTSSKTRRRAWIAASHPADCSRTIEYYALLSLRTIEKRKDWIWISFQSGLAFFVRTIENYVDLLLSVRTIEKWLYGAFSFFSKTLFDFKKSISGLIELTFSGKTPNEVLYAPIYFWGVYF